MSITKPLNESMLPQEDSDQQPLREGLGGYGSTLNDCVDAYLNHVYSTSEQEKPKGMSRDELIIDHTFKDAANEGVTLNEKQNRLVWDGLKSYLKLRKEKGDSDPEVSLQELSLVTFVNSCPSNRSAIQESSEQVAPSETATNTKSTFNECVDDIVKRLADFQSYDYKTGESPDERRVAAFKDMANQDARLNVHQWGLLRGAVINYLKLVKEKGESHPEASLQLQSIITFANSCR